MTGFSGMNWAKKIWDKAKSLTPGKAQLNSLTGKLKSGKDTVLALIIHNKKSLIWGTSACVMVVAVVVTGHSYVKANSIDVYRVTVAGEDVGIISDPTVYDTYKVAREQKLAEQFPKVHMELPEREGSSLIQFDEEKLFKPDLNDDALLAKLDLKIEPDTIGAELRVDGVMVGYVKDEQTVETILATIKEDYSEPKPLPVVALSLDTERKAAPLVASAPNATPESVSVDHVEIVEDIDVILKKIEPQDVLSPEEMLEILRKGNVAPFVYTVVDGDTISQIAKKLNVSVETIYERNPWIVDDMIKPGDKIDLTQVQPTVSVRTEETVVEHEEMAYETEFVTDDKLLAGNKETIQKGQSGLKKMQFHLVKVNGQVINEDLVSEEVIKEPIKEIIKKGTLVIKGEGSGTFAWPIYGPKITSTFGKRWGKMHKGLDMTGNKNIMASDNAVVVAAGTHKDYGNYIKLDHKNGYETVYMHMSKLLVKKGDIVQKGDKIGIMGNTGQSFGTHLHFEIYKNGTPVNPMQYLKKK